LRSRIRFAIISDIHSNLPALTRALSIIDSLRIDQVCCIGCIGNIGQPRDGNPMLSFGVFNIGVLCLGIIRVEYGIAQTARSILDAGLPSFLAERLFKGM
jgi:diadenosine tetraphosphatase ApaH/serine/threonine PP2A family protein phosphatase